MITKVKKNPAEYDKLTKEFYEETSKKGINQRFAHYVWDILIAMSRGYGFNQSHTLAYSLIALQEMNLAYKYPIIFWNCACLISNAGGNDSSKEEEDIDDIDNNTEESYSNEMEEFTDEDNESDVEDEYYEDEDCDGYPAEIKVMKDNKKKKKVKATNYGKISTAIGKIKEDGVSIVPPDINNSGYTFTPDVEKNTIRYGLSGITRIGDELIKEIISGRPYSSMNDFITRIKVNKPQMINLIKSGAFDSFGDRIEIMHEYINSISDTKKRITLQNMKMLIDFGLIPDEYDLQKRVYNFNKYIKKLKLDSTYYGLDEIAFSFYAAHFDIDKLIKDENTGSGFKIRQTYWDSIYKKHMDIVRPYIQKNSSELLSSVNNMLTKNTWDKYCLGNLSKWEMDSVSFYSHEHELAKVNMTKYGLSHFNDLSENPVIDKIVSFKSKTIPIFKIYRICGTVLDRNKSKKTVTLLTTDGVVTVKIYGVFAQYDKQISEHGVDGKKHVIRKSEFARGNKIIVTGIREGDNFIAKKYKSTPYHLIEQIKSVSDNGNIELDIRQSE